MIGHYYLHSNGCLIFKSSLSTSVADLVESPFVREFWPVDETDRACAWRICLEGRALGANSADVKRLEDKWGLDLSDLLEYLSREDRITGRLQKGLRSYLEDRGVDFDTFFNALTEKEGTVGEKGTER